jgi:hypothetical protein
MKIVVFWDVAQCSFVEVYRRFTDAHCLHHQGDDGSVIALKMYVRTFARLLCENMKIKI